MEEKWKVFKSGDEWDVFKLDSKGKKTGSKLGTHSSEKKANAQVAALNINVKESEKLQVRVNHRKSVRKLEEFHMDMFVSTFGAQSFKDLIASEDAAERSKIVRKRAAQLTEMIIDITWNSSIENKPAAFEALFTEFMEIANNIFNKDIQEIESNSEKFTESINSQVTELEEIDLSKFDLMSELEPAKLNENELEIINKIANNIAEGKVDPQRAPLFMNVAIIEPGWGNSNDNHYYPQDMLEKHSNKFSGSKMYETDHDNSNRSTANWVSTSTGHVGSTESGGIVHRVFVHDPGFAERMRNLKSAEMSEKMECSILADGMVEKKEWEDDEGRKGKRVASIESVTAVDWVTRAGAGGRVRSLIETSNGGSKMKKDELKKLLKEVLEEDGVELTKVVIQEKEENTTEGEQPKDEKPIIETKEVEPVYLAANEIEELLKDSQLPEVTLDRIKAGKYLSIGELAKAHKSAVKEISSLTGAGQPFGLNSKQQENQNGDVVKALSLEERNKKLDEVDQRLGVL